MKHQSGRPGPTQIVTMIVVAPGLDRACVVVTDSRYFGKTENLCGEEMTTLIRADLNMNKD